MSLESKDGFVNASLARLYLCIGGLFGLHRLYCGQPFVSMIYLSTFGIFFLGPLWDVFYLNGIVQTYNDKLIKSRFEEIEREEKKKNPRFSLTRFIGQVFYSVWLGFLAIILASFLFKDTTDRLGLTLICSLAIASGVWVAGCCDDKKCEFLYAFIASLSTAVFTVYWADGDSIKSLVVIAVASTLNSNRSLKWKSPNDDNLSTKYFMFCVSLFLTCFCVLWVGLSRTVFHREIAFLPNESTIRMKTVDVGTFVADYAFERKKDMIKEYPLNDHTIEFVPMLKFGNSSNIPWKRKKSRQHINLPHLQLLNLFRKFNYELEFFDDQEMVAEFHWLRYLTTFITDYTRFSTINLYRNREQNSLKLTLWRMYLIQSLQLDPFVSDKDVIKKCQPYKIKSEVLKDHRTKKDDEKVDWSAASKTRACELLQKALKQD